ncbi:MAG: 4Fe-4S binding protein, partial [Acidaminococcaceae bacterium]
LAEAIVSGQTGVSPCLACTPSSKQAIARLMGYVGETPMSPSLRRIARVACNGCKEHAPKLYEYQGIKDCHLVAKYFGGPGKCNFGCLGLGSCVKFCPFHAITMGDHGLPIIDYEKCTGCGVCVQQCPQMVLYISTAARKIHLKCNNRDKGKAALGDCSVSCISCGICVKNCPVQAITMREDVNGSLPVIDPSKCIECGLCVQKCPRHCLQLIEPITTLIAPLEPLSTANSCATCASRENCGLHQ